MNSSLGEPYESGARWESAFLLLAEPILEDLIRPYARRHFVYLVTQDDIVNPLSVTKRIFGRRVRSLTDPVGPPQR